MVYESAIVQTHDIGENVKIGEFSVIRDGVRLGNNVIIHPHVVIESGVILGDEVEVFPGAYIGKEPKGAGALARPLTFNRYVKIEGHTSIGPNVVIYYDVEIGEHSLI